METPVSQDAIANIGDELILIKRSTVHQLIQTIKRLQQASFDSLVESVAADCDNTTPLFKSLEGKNARPAQSVPGPLPGA